MITLPSAYAKHAAIEPETGDGGKRRSPHVHPVELWTLSRLAGLLTLLIAVLLHKYYIVLRWGERDGARRRGNSIPRVVC